MNSKNALLIAAATVLLQCEQSDELTIPMFPDGGLLRSGQLLSREQLFMFEGMYTTAKGNSLFGNEVAVRTSPGTISVLSEKNAGFSVLGAACMPDRKVVVEGYWQYPTLLEAGLVRLFVGPSEFAESLCDGETPDADTSFTLDGHYGNDSEFPRSPLTLRWSRQLKPWRGRFLTDAHQGAWNRFAWPSASARTPPSSTCASRATASRSCSTIRASHARWFAVPSATARLPNSRSPS